MAWPSTTIITTDMDAGTDSAANARAQIKQMADNVNDIMNGRNQASGVCPLDASTLVPTTNLPIVPATKGGTDQSSYAVGDILYANTTTTLTKLAAGTSGYALTSNGPGAAPSYQQVGGFPAGTRMSFQQTAAPTGWTKDTTAALNDCAMRIVTGTAGSGGTNGLSTANVGATTLATSQLASHGHTAKYYTAVSAALGSSNGFNGNSTTMGMTSTGPSYTASDFTGATGSGGSHTHSLAIKYYDFIVASKN